MNHLIIHVWGFGAYDESPEDIVADVKVTTYDGDLADVANSVLDAIDHPMTVSTVRTLDGWLTQVHAVVDVDGEDRMWHRFLTASGQWPRLRAKLAGTQAAYRDDFAAQDDQIGELTAERDQARATVERVRALIGTGYTITRSVDNGGGVAIVIEESALESALDGELR